MKRTVLVRDIRVLRFDQRDEGACFTGRGQKKKVADADSSAKLALISTSSPYIFHPYLQCFCWSDSPKTRSYNQGFLWSHLTIILDTKSTALTGTGCQIKPFNDKFSPKVSWEISSGLHCGKKSFELDIELKQTFFLPLDPWSLTVFTTSSLSLRSTGNF